MASKQRALVKQKTYNKFEEIEIDIDFDEYKDYKKQKKKSTQKYSEQKAINKYYNIEFEQQKTDPKKLKYLFEPDQSNCISISSEEMEVQEIIQKKIVKQETIKKEAVNDQNIINTLDDLRYKLRIEILKRWWYCFGEWPPKNYDYKSHLEQHHLRQVDSFIFKDEYEYEKGLRKVYQVQGYPGIFKASNNETFDLRPQESIPSIKNIREISHKILPKLLLRGLKAQLEDLIKYEPENKKFQFKLQRQIVRVEDKFSKYLQ